MKWDWMKNWVLKHKSISVVLSIIGILFGTSFFIHIINIQSYPFVGDPWTTNFTVVGKGDLKVTPFNGTFFGEDINFTSLRCGDNIVLPSIITDEYVLFKDYYCFFESHFEVDVLTTGKHSLMFDFGGSLAYAYNNASVKEEVKEVVWKDNCQVKCVGNKCNRLIGRTFYVNDTDGVCKPIEKAKSLKNSPLKLVVEGDGYHNVEIIDYNLTAVKLKLKIKDKIQKKSVPLKIIKPVINISSDEEKQEFVKKKFFVEKSKENLIFNSQINPIKEYDKIININFSNGEYVKYGENSTTIKLQDANTENLDDTYIRYNDPDNAYGADSNLVAHNHPFDTHYIMIKFANQTPSTANIIDASLNLYLDVNNLDSSTEGFNLSFYLVSGFTINGADWREDNVTWNTQPNSGQRSNESENQYKYFGGDGEPVDVWQSWNVTEAMIEAHTNDYTNITFMGITHNRFGSPLATDTIFFDSKEWAAEALRPYLNITYSEAPPNTPPTTPTSLRCNNSDNCNITWTNTSLTLNCSGSTDSDGDTITYVLEASNTTASQSKGWWNSSFTRRRTINVTSIGTLTDFPVLINVSKDNDMQSDYDDIRFVNGSCGTSNTTLSYEIDTKTANYALFWVKISLNTGTNSLCVYYGNSSVSTTQNPSDVWSNGYVGVWHLNEQPNGTAPQIIDSTSFNNDGTSYGTMTASDSVSGIIGNALDFDGINDHINLGNNPVLNMTTNDWTIETWHKIATGISQEVLYADGGDNAGGHRMTTEVGEKTGDRFTLTTDDDSTKIQTEGDDDVADNNWHYGVAMRSGGTNFYTYVDGVLDGSNTCSANYDLKGTSQTDARIGAIWDASAGSCCLKYFSGTIDEVRISNISRSADWINQTYQLVVNQASFVNFGSEENLSSQSKNWNVIGNHTDGNTFGWNVTSWNGTNNIDLRCRAIDLSGSNTYSAYYTKNSKLNISISAAPPPNTCSCPSPPSNWRINMPDHCNITSNCNINGYNLSFENGTSTDLVNISATIVCDNLNHNTTGIVHIDSNGYIYINKT